MNDKDFERYLIIWKTCDILRRSRSDKFIDDVVIKKFSNYLSTTTYSYTNLFKECVNRILRTTDEMEERWGMPDISVGISNSTIYGVRYTVYLDGSPITEDKVISLFYKSYKTTGSLNLWPILN